MIFEVTTRFYNAKWELDSTTIRLFGEDVRVPMRMSAYHVKTL